MPQSLLQVIPVIPGMIPLLHKEIIGISVLLFLAGLIVYLMVKGRASNPLHSSLLRWSFILMILVLAAVAGRNVYPLIERWFEKISQSESLQVVNHAKLSCEQIQNYVRTYGKQTVIQGARAHGYSDKVIQDVLRRCGIV